MRHLSRSLTTAVALAAIGIAGPALSQQFTPQTVGHANPRASGATNDDMREMPITDILNRLSAQGYAQYRNIQRFGPIYLVDAVTTDFRDVTLEVNTQTGTIQEVR